MLFRKLNWITFTKVIQFSFLNSSAKGWNFFLKFCIYDHSGCMLFSVIRKFHLCQIQCSWSIEYTYYNIQIVVIFKL